RPRRSTSSYCCSNKPVLQRPVESGQYTSREFAQVAASFGVRLSTGRTGVCWDNAFAESFFATLKRELGASRHQVWASRATAHSAVFEFIEGWFNLRRLHSSLGYRSPTEYEAALAA
ncbi:transposase, partial [Streptomyces aculeolatus]